MPSPNASRLAARPRPAFELVLGARAWRAAPPPSPVGVVGLRERGAEHGHHRVADELHHGAARAEDGPVHRGPVLVELARRGAVGSARSAIAE